MDAFYAAVEQRDHPEMRGRPVIVCADPRGGGGGGRRHRVRKQRRFRVGSAMPISQAWRWLLRPVRPDMEKYAAVSRQGDGGAASSSRTRVSRLIDEAFLDVTGSRRLFALPRTCWPPARASSARFRRPSRPHAGSRLPSAWPARRWWPSRPRLPQAGRPRGRASGHVKRRSWLRCPCAAVGRGPGRWKRCCSRSGCAPSASSRDPRGWAAAGDPRPDLVQLALGHRRPRGREQGEDAKEHAARAPRSAPTPATASALHATLLERCARGAPAPPARRARAAR